MIRKGSFLRKYFQMFETFFPTSFKTKIDRSYKNILKVFSKYFQNISGVRFKKFP